jgi:hypothetical protein
LAWLTSSKDFFLKTAKQNPASCDAGFFVCGWATLGCKIKLINTQSTHHKKEEKYGKVYPVSFI